MPCGHSYSAAKATGEKKMMANETSVHEQHLSPLALFLYERGTHIPRGLSVNYLGRFFKLTLKNLRTTLRCTKEGICMKYDGPIEDLQTVVIGMDRNVTSCVDKGNMHQIRPKRARR